MTHQYWILKSEPNAYSYQDLERDGKTVWDGVRNYQARNNLKAMAVGDQALIYHSISEKALVGLAKVSKAHYPDPTDNPKGDWVVVEIQPVHGLQRSISLAELKADPRFDDLPLIKQSRLSVMPISAEHFQQLLALSKTVFKAL
jgi:predicted RNA-binding protein with PUA-like domain